MNLRLLLWAVALLAVFACGGGGGGGGGASTAGELVYTTDWAGVTGSQRLTIRTAEGKIVRSVTLERTQAGPETYRLSGLPEGPATVTADLYTQPGQGGVRSGTLESQLTIQGQTPFSSRAGAAPQTLRVAPGNIALEVPEGVRFRALALDASGTPTFTAPGSIAWQIVGSVGSISVDGALATSNPGTATIRATHVPTGKTATATVDVAPGNPAGAKWTILVYMNAASDLYQFSDLNMRQLEQVSDNPDVRFVVQWKQAQSVFDKSSFDGTRRYVVGPEGRKLVQDLGPGMDMGRAQNLKGFIDWGKLYFPAQRYGLVVWSHGNGWRRRPERERTRAVSYDDETGNAIQIWELNTALAGHQFDFLAWDASLMQMMEVAYEARTNTRFVVGSEESPPAEGYPYDRAFAGFRDSPDSATRDLTKGFVDAMVSGYPNRKITQSVIDTVRLAELEEAIDGLATQLIANKSSLSTAYQQVRNEAQSYSPNAGRYYRDLYDVCSRLEALVDIPTVDAACQNVRAKLAAAVAWEGHSPLSPGSHGISIDMTPGQQFFSIAADYGRMQFGRDNLWDDWLPVSP